MDQQGISTFQSFLDNTPKGPTLVVALQMKGTAQIAEVLEKSGVANPQTSAAGVIDQLHIFEHYHSLPENTRTVFLDQVFGSVDFAGLDDMWSQMRRTADSIDFDSLQTPEYTHLPTDRDTELGDDWQKARVHGESIIRDGSVAVMTMAGGAGTRLGHDGPKGTYRITPVLGKTFFEIQAGKIQFYREKFGSDIQWYIMTSSENDDQTHEYFEQNDYLGLPSQSIHFFSQGTNPAFDERGKIILESKDSISLNADGTGGLAKALNDQGILNDLEERQIQHVMMYNIDNALAPILNPHLLGFHAMKGSAMGSMMVKKALETERIGTFSLDENGGLQVIEYSELPLERQFERDEKSGELVHGLGSTGVNVMTVEALREVSENFRFIIHSARKKIHTTLGPDVWGYKPETFFHDCFRLFRSDTAFPYFLMEAKRAGSFSPVKNKFDQDSPERARADLNKLWASWLRYAGIPIITHPDGLPAREYEIDPRLAVDHASAREILRNYEKHRAYSFGAAKTVYYGPDSQDDIFPREHHETEL